MGFGMRIVTLADQWSGGTGPDSLFEVNDEGELDEALKRVRRLSGRLQGPTSVFVRVANPIWRNVVLRLVVETDAVLIDVTTPSPSVLWEIETVGARVRPRWVLVGEIERLRQLAQVVPALRRPTADSQSCSMARPSSPTVSARTSSHSSGRCGRGTRW